MTIFLHLPKNWMIFSCLSLATAKASLKNSILAFLSFNVLMATTMVFSFVSSKTVPLYTLPKAPLPTISNLYQKIDDDQKTLFQPTSPIILLSFLMPKHSLLIQYQLVTPKNFLIQFLNQPTCPVSTQPHQNCQANLKHGL